MDEENAFTIDDQSTSDTYEEHHQIFQIIDKIREVVKIFRRSPVQSDNILQKYIRKSLRKNIHLSWTPIPAGKVCWVW